jgi:glucose/arabinose dehydrogenase
MPVRSWFGAALVAVVASLIFAASAAVARPSRPVAASGNRVQVVGTGVTVPTAFAFAGSTVFAGSGPDEATGATGGLFTLAHGSAIPVPNGPESVFGLAWHGGKLYVSTGLTIIALSGWNGTAFSASETIYADEAAGFAGFNGLAFGPNGRLYANLALEEQNYDHSKDPFPLSQAVVSMTAAGQNLRVVASGLRQPFQLTFPEGFGSPYVTVLSQDRGPGPTPPDQIVVAKNGRNFGFPTCTWLQASACRGFSKPLIFLPEHASPMGIGSIKKTLFVALYGGLGRGPEVVAIPTKGGKPKPFLSGFGAPLVALAVHRGDVYVGNLTGTIYRVAAAN